MKKNFNKALTLTLCLALSASIMSPVLAAENDAIQTSPVKLIAQPIVFDVGVPTGLPVDVDANGEVTVATNVKIENHSAAPISIAGVQVNPIPDWSIVPMNKDFKGTRIGTKEFGFVLNSDEVPANGAVALTKANWPSINGSSSLPLVYNSVVAPQKDAITDNKIADVVFTIGWDVNDFALSSESLSIEKGGSSKLNLLGVDSAVWSSSNESVATVDQTGLVTPLDWGTTTITATANGVSKTCEVTVPKIQNGLEMNVVSKTIGIGKTFQLTATSKFRAGTVWTSSNPEIATVSTSGLVTGVSEGTTTITATQGGFTATCNITVNKYILATDADFSGTTDGTFKYIGTDEYVEIPHVIKGIPVTSYANMFSGTSVNGVKSTNPNITNMSSMFNGSLATTSLDLSNFDTSNVTNMSSMFNGSLATTSLDLSNFDTSNVTNMSSMFNGSLATNIKGLSSFNTSKVTDMSTMFYYSQATTLDLSSFDTSNVTNMNSMFANSKATTLDLSSFNTSNVTDMSGMFNVSKATTLNLSSFDTSNVTNMNLMFMISKATTLDLSSFDTSKVTSMTLMFSRSYATTGYARTQEDAKKFNTTEDKPSTLTFRCK